MQPPKFEESLHRSHRPTLDKLRLVEGLMQVLLTATHVGYPVYHPANYRADIACDVGYRRLAPGKVRARLRADQRNILRYTDSPRRKKMVHRNVEKRFVNDQGCWRSVVEKRLEDCIKSFRALLPVRQIVGTGSDPTSFQRIKKGPHRK